MEDTLLEEINSFASTITDPRLKALITDLIRKNEELTHRITGLEIQQDDQADAINRNSGAINQMWRVLNRSPSVPKGQKTTARLKDLDKILKATGGRTLGQLEKDLNISSSQMSKLISKLDMRRYKLFNRDGDGREKVLELKSRII
jgi:uncharacterized coiled-coil protein SlyX